MERFVTSVVRTAFVHTAFKAAKFSISQHTLSSKPYWWSVCSSTMYQRNLIIYVDTSRSAFCRNLRHSLPLLPQGKTHPVRMDRLRPMYLWLNHYCAQWPPRTVRVHYHRVQEAFPRTLVPRFWRCVHPGVVGHLVLRCSEVWKDEYDLLHFGLLAYWRTERELHAGLGRLYSNFYPGE